MRTATHREIVSSTRTYQLFLSCETSRQKPKRTSKSKSESQIAEQTPLRHVPLPPLAYVVGQTRPTLPLRGEGGVGVEAARGAVRGGTHQFVASLSRSAFWQTPWTRTLSEAQSSEH